MSDLTLLHESTVDDSEIDSLGHMNVRYYVSRAAQANQALLRRVGIDMEVPGCVLRRIDTYSRFHREQFEGAPLHTFGGLIAAEGMIGSDGLRAYFEIRNPDNDALAATFILTSNLINIASQEMAGLPAPAEPTRSEFMVHIPRHGMPRSLSLTPPPSVALATLEDLIGDSPTPGMMSGRREGEVRGEDCDAAGHLREDVELMFIVHRPAPGQDTTVVGPPLMESAGGIRYSWAMTETRSIVHFQPSTGDRVVSLGADIAHGDKWRQSRRWMFDQTDGRPLGVSDTVGLCIDLDARRAIAIPSDVCEDIEQTMLPQLA